MTIEHLPQQQFIKAYDKSGTLFFLDPSYIKAPYYNYNLKISDFEQLAATPADVRSDFVLSINDHSEMRKTYGNFNGRQVKLPCSVAQGEWVKAKELLNTK